MKNLLETKIKSGQFDPCKKISKSIQDLKSSYSRANKTIHNMHSEDEITLSESLDREFLSYSRKMRSLVELQFSDEQKKMTTLRNEFFKIFGVDVWDDVIQNCEFNTIQEFYDCVKTYVRINYA